MTAKIHKMRERYSAQNAPRCRDCGRSSADWVEDAAGIRWTTKLVRDHDGNRWICTRCKG